MKRTRRRTIGFLLLAISAAGGIAITALANAASSGLTAQTSREGGVNVTVTPRSLAPGAPGWDFEVVLETHTQPLDQDLTRTAELIDAQGKPHAPLAWDGTPPGGHHRRGVLRFQPLAGNPAAVELRLHDIGGVATRAFRWQLR